MEITILTTQKFYICLPSVQVRIGISFLNLEKKFANRTSCINLT